MICHILLFKFNAGASPMAIDSMIDRFIECKEKLSGITEVKYGENVSSKKHLSHGFTYGVIMYFKSWQDIGEYNVSEGHKNVLESQKGLVNDVLVFDVEF